MRVGVVTLFPQMFDALLVGGVTARAIKQGLLRLTCWNPRDFTKDKHQRVDDQPYGGGPGMIMQVQPLRAAIAAALTTLGPQTHIVYLSPQGRRLDQAGVETLRHHAQLLLIAGHYEGIDERILLRDVHSEWSIGDYVLSGGELAAMVMIDALTRWIPGVLKHERTLVEDSFGNGLLDYPHYTRPAEIDGQSVPTVLLSGNHAAIARWRQKQALGRTWCRYPELLEKLHLTTQQKALLNEFIEELNKGDAHDTPLNLSIRKRTNEKG